MGKVYDLAPPEVTERVQRMMQAHHKELVAAELKVDVLMVSTDGDGPALKWAGCPAYAIVRIVALRDRAKGAGDAEIQIDLSSYNAMPPTRRDALIDHELTHLLVRKDKDGQFELDDHMRPKLKMRDHDVQVGWFQDVALRHRDQSFEVLQAREIGEKYGQIFFDFLGA